MRKVSDVKKRTVWQKIFRWFRNLWILIRLVPAWRIKSELDSAYSRKFLHKPIEKGRDEAQKEMFYRLGFIHATEEIARRLDIPLEVYFDGGPDR